MRIILVTLSALVLGSTLLHAPRAECQVCFGPCGTSAECQGGCVCAGGPGVGTCVPGK